MNVRVNGVDIRVSRARTVIIGSGCAGLNAAGWLAALPAGSAVLMTDGMRRGTSRNAGSDKQTYYKLSLAGEPDSPAKMADTLLAEGVNGDTALIEAACSAQAFFKLVQLGVPFPTNEYGEFVGYQTDHDAHRRATSAGPLTSKLMTEALEAQLTIPVMDQMIAFQVLTHEERVAGVLAYDAANHSLALVLTAHVILATGGPAHVYAASVFPESQMGMSGMAIMAGARMANLHQWQYGLASTKFRWNVSGSYQQVLPRYVSIDERGVEREFLSDYFDDPVQAVRLIFLKGYQWPFDVRKVDGSSLIDLIVHRETEVLKRRTYMDFRRNPSALGEGLANLDGEAREYLENTGAVHSTPYDRLAHMNLPAIELYRAHGIDLAEEMLEIRVCAQHHNGGVAVDTNWQSSIRGLYAAGEAAGTFGAYRPGGSALNASQVGSMRAAQHIAYDSELQPMESPEMLTAQIERALDGLGFGANPCETAIRARTDMSACGAHMRDMAALAALDERLKDMLSSAGGILNALPDDFAERIRLRDQLITQRAVISAMRCAAEIYGSTGAGLIMDDRGAVVLKALGMRALAHSGSAENLVIHTALSGYDLESAADPARPIPRGEQWFENAWRNHRMRISKGEDAQ